MDSIQGNKEKDRGTESEIGAKGGGRRGASENKKPGRSAHSLANRVRARCAGEQPWVED